MVIIGGISMARTTETNTENIVTRHTEVNASDSYTARHTVPNYDEGGVSRQTVPNTSENMGTRQTVPNYDDVQAFRRTVANYSENAPRHTVTNNEGSNDRLRIGDMVGTYRIIDRLNNDSGEADLFLAEANGRKYALKYYRRPNAVDFEIYDKLMKSGHQNLAQIHSFDYIDGLQYEVMEYYPSGSLKGKILGAEEIRTKLVPQMNEAIEALRKRDIIHKDIKPSNIMINDVGDYVLIDFGVSQLIRDGRTHAESRSGTTYDYLAPECFRSKQYSVLSDYYALGMSIYELMIGHLPADDMSKEESAEFYLYNGLPFPSDFPEDIKNLILGLTYLDIKNRHDKTNPNNRWDYEVVKRWCNGEALQTPGNAVFTQPERNMPAQGGKRIEFNGGVYESLDELIIAMAHNWNEGIKFIQRGDASEQFRKNDLYNMANFADDVIESSNIDGAYATFLYASTSELDEICYRGESYSPEELGSKILSQLWSLGHGYEKDHVVRELYAGAPSTDDMSSLEKYCKMIFEENSVVSQFYLARSKRADRTDIPSQAVDTIYYEDLKQWWKNRPQSSEQLAAVLFEIANKIMGKAVYRGENSEHTVFNGKDEMVTAFRNTIQNGTVQDVENFLGIILNDPHNEKPYYWSQYRGWIKAVTFFEGLGE